MKRGGVKLPKFQNFLVEAYRRNPCRAVGTCRSRDPTVALGLSHKMTSIASQAFHEQEQSVLSDGSLIFPPGFASHVDEAMMTAPSTSKPRWIYAYMAWRDGLLSREWAIKTCRVPIFGPSLPPRPRPELPRPRTELIHPGGIQRPRYPYNSTTRPLQIPLRQFPAHT